MLRSSRTLLVACLLTLSSFVIRISSLVAADAAPQTDARYPFRTDFANPHLPWYQPKPLEFPPHHSDHRVSGELVSADFIHRTGQFRATKTGELMDFTLPPYGVVQHLFAESDLRDVPLGTFFLFFLNQDEQGNFTRLATAQDQFTMDAGHSFTYRLDEVKSAEGKLIVTKHSIPKKQENLGKAELKVTPDTRFWKGGNEAKLTDLKPGDELLYNITGKTASSPGWCTDVWVGTDTHQLATKQQRTKFDEFTKARGLPGWIEKTEGSNVTVTFFSGDIREFKAAFAPDFAVGSEVKVCVANDELRTWNPPVDGDRGKVLETQTVATDGYGCSGLRVVMKVTNMLEGFRRGRVIRVFGQGWKVQDQFFGESLMGYGYGRLLDEELKENPPKEYPDQFPFRTDYSNPGLPWYQLKPDQEPPPYAEHVVHGGIVEVNADTGTGKFRTERTGELVDFTLLPGARVRYQDTTATLADIPTGTRCRFHLFQDAQGRFTKTTLVSDDYSHLASNAVSLRIISLEWDAGTIHVASQMPEVKNYNGDMVRPPGIGRAVLRVTPQTKVWKADRPMDHTRLAVGDSVRVNLTDEQPGSPSRCTSIWVLDPAQIEAAPAADSGKKKSR